MFHKYQKLDLRDVELRCKVSEAETEPGERHVEGYPRESLPEFPGGPAECYLGWALFIAFTNLPLPAQNHYFHSRVTVTITATAGRICTHSGYLVLNE